MASTITKVSGEEHVEKLPNTHQKSDLNDVGVDNDRLDARYWRSFRFLGSCLAIILLANGLFLGYSVPANILTVINAELGPSSDVYLVSLINTLVKGVGLLVVGRISDIVGRRYFIIGGQLCALIGAVVSAKASSINALIGASVFSGLGGCAQVLYPLLSQELVPNKYRGWSQAAISAAVLPVLGFGPVIARSLVADPALGWRWCYWLNALVTAVSLILFITCYFPPGFHDLHAEISKRQLLKRIDYVGFVLYAGGLICLLLALSWGGRKYPWASATVISTLVVGILTLVAFVLYEVYMPLSQPLLPMKLFRIRNFSVSVAVGSVGQMSFYALNVLWPTQIVNLYTKNQHKIGWMSSTTGIALVMGEVVCGPWFRRVGHIKWQMVVGLCGLMIVGGCLALGNEHRQDLAIALTAVSGIFIGWIELVAIVVAGLVIPPEDIGTGQAFFASTRAVSGTLATSIYLAIYQNKVEVLMPAKITPAVERAGFPPDNLPQLYAAIANGTKAALHAVPGITNATITALGAAQKSAWAASFATVYLSSLAFGVAALIIALFASDVDQYLTSFVNKTIGQPAFARSETGIEKV